MFIQKKRLFSILLLLVLCLTLTAPIHAVDISDYEAGEIRVINSSNLSSAEVQKIVDASEAYIVSDDGTITPVRAEISIVNVSAPYCLINGYPVGKTYQATITASTSGVEKPVADSDSLNNSAVHATSTLSMTWIDNSGTNNTIKTVSGTLNVISGTVTEGTVRWGEAWVSALKWVKKDVGDETSFSYSPNYTTFAPIADYSVRFEDSNFGLYCCVRSSVLQG